MQANNKGDVHKSKVDLATFVTITSRIFIRRTKRGFRGHSIGMGALKIAGPIDSISPLVW
jgi:hypothetical protein